MNDQNMSTNPRLRDGTPVYYSPFIEDNKVMCMSDPAMPRFYIAFMGRVAYFKFLWSSRGSTPALDWMESVTKGVIHERIDNFSAALLFISENRAKL